MYFIQTSLCLYDIATLPSLLEDKNNVANSIRASYIRPPTPSLPLYYVDSKNVGYLQSSPYRYKVLSSMM